MSAKPYRCSKCKSLNIYLDEHAITHIIHDPHDPKGLQEPGPIIKVMLCCRDCKYESRLRGIVCTDDEQMERLVSTQAAIDAAKLQP